MAKIRIKSLPKALSGLEIKMRPGLYGTNGNRQFSLPTQIDSQKYAEPDVKVGGVLGPVPREEANLEAEKGETAVLNVGGIPAHFTIGGKRHSEGGTPLNLPDNSFIFSDTAKMKIKDPQILAQFGMSIKKGGYTPADIAKKYDINKFRKVLADKESDDLERSTAEMMIANYNDKLAKLALAQESIKGFPQGIPVIAMPYIIANDIDPAQFVPTQGQEEEPDADMGVSRFGGNIVSQLATKQFGGLKMRDGMPIAQDGFWSKLGQGALSVLEAPQRSMMYLGTGLFGDDYVEMLNPKTGKYEMVHEDNAEEFAKKYGYAPTGKKTTWSDRAKYEMPGETLKRTYPESSPWLQGAADIFADPFLVSGLAKTGARLATKKLIKETADAVATGSMRGLTKEEMVNQIIKNAGKSATPKNINIVSKSLDAGAGALLKAKGKGAVSQAKAVEKAVAKAAGKARQVEDIKQAGEKLGEAGKFVKEKVIKPVAKGIKKRAKIVGEGVVAAAEAASGPYAGPIVMPIAKNIPGAVKSNIYKGEAEELKKQVATAKSQLEEQKKTSNWIPSGSDNSGIGMFTNPAYPGQTFMYISGQGYIPYEPASTQEVSQDTLRGLSEEEINKMMGLDEMAYGGSTLFKAKEGVSVQGGKYYFTDAKGQTAEISKEKYDKYIEKQKLKDVTIQKTKPTVTKKSAIDLFPEEEEERQKWMASNPDSTVDEETYNKLVELYEKAKKADPTGTKETKEAEEFQKEYHKVLPQTAGQIIASAGKKTRKALKEGRTWWDLEGNVDKFFGPRTIQYFEALKKKKPTPDKVEEPTETPSPKVQIKPEEKKTFIPGQEVKRNIPTPLRAGAKAPWFLQDIINTAGAYGDLARIKRYQPWQATPQVYLPEMVPYDPTRELAANAEQANIAMQAQQAFTNPQQLAAASSVIQGKALANAADIMGKYNNLNVGLANQLEKERANLLNQASQQRAALDTQLWDKYTIANQQFDNSKALARQELRKNVVKAVDNRAKMQVVNSLFPNYQIDPSTGGMMTFSPDYSKIKPEQPNFANDYYQALQMTGDPNAALKYLELQYKGSIGGSGNERDSYLRSLYGQEREG